MAEGAIAEEDLTDIQGAHVPMTDIRGLLGINPSMVAEVAVRVAAEESLESTVRECTLNISVSFHF